MLLYRIQTTSLENENGTRFNIAFFAKRRSQRSRHLQDAHGDEFEVKKILNLTEKKSSCHRTCRKLS